MNKVKTFSYWIITAAAVNFVGYFLVWLNNDSKIFIYISRGIIHGMSIFLASSIALNITENEKRTRRNLNWFNLIVSIIWGLLGIAQILIIIVLLYNNHSFSDLFKDNPNAFTDISGGIAVSYASLMIYKNKELVFVH
jgi:hypothetical protein